MDRKVTDESMIQWRNDENASVQDTHGYGRVKFLSPEVSYASGSGVRKMVARSTDLSPLAISFGDFNPWAGDWSQVVGSNTQERRLAAPTSVIWVTFQNTPSGVSGFTSLLDMYKEIVSLIPQIKAGNIYYNAVGPDNVLTWNMLWDESITSAWSNIYFTTDPDSVNNVADLDGSFGPWLPFPALMDGLESLLDMTSMQFYQGDTAKIKISANPFGGDTHEQLKAIHDLLQSESSASINSAMPMHNYTEVASLPSDGSDVTLTFDGGMDIADAIYAWGDGDWTGGQAETSVVDDLSIAAPKVALADIESNAAGHTLTFPLFVNKAVSGSNHGTLSFYQPHLLPGGDNFSAKVLSAAGGYGAPNGFMSSGKMQDLCVTTAGLPFKFPDVEATHSFWIDGAKEGRVGSYGIADADRPWHAEVIAISPSIALHYETNKVRGDGSFSFGTVGYSYDATPISTSDWPVIMYHVNPMLKHAQGSTFSVANSVFWNGARVGLEIASFTQPFKCFAWEDHGGVGANYEQDVDLKGYRFKYQNPDLAVPKAARLDSRKAQGGFKPAPIFTIPFIRDKFKLWESKLDSAGVITTAGRFDAISASDAGMVESVGGPMFTSTPDLQANLYCAWTAETEKTVIGRFTVKVI